MRDKEIWRKLESNAGFTLVELLCSMMIFSFFAMALLQYMTTAATIHTQVNSSVSLETQALATLGVIEEYAIDASASVVFDDGTKTLYIINNNSYDDVDTGCKVHAFQLVKNTGDTTGNLRYFTTANTAANPLTKTVTTVNVTYHDRTGPDTGSGAEKAVYVTRAVSVYDSSSSSTTVPTTTTYFKYTTLELAQAGAMAGSGTTVDALPALTEGWVEFKSYDSDSSVTFSTITGDANSVEVMTGNMSDFDVDFEIIEGKINKIVLTLEMKKGSNTYYKEASIALRNQPPAVVTGTVSATPPA